MAMNLKNLKSGATWLGACVWAAGLVGPVAVLANPAEPGPVALGWAALTQASSAPESVGALVYRGATFAQGVAGGDPMFRYERRVRPMADGGLVASHVTRELQGQPLIVESALMGADYRVQRFEVVNRQQGFVGQVTLSADGRTLSYTLDDQGRRSTATETVSAPVVCGPSMFGYIRSHWDRLRQGATLPVRVVVMKEKTTYGFELKHERDDNGEVTFSLVPSSLLVRLALAPLKVVFDAQSRQPLRYLGRVPPMEPRSGGLKDLDARVEYHAEPGAYR